MEQDTGSGNSVGANVNDSLGKPGADAVSKIGSTPGGMPGSVSGNMSGDMTDSPSGATSGATLSATHSATHSDMPSGEQSMPDSKEVTGTKKKRRRSAKKHSLLWLKIALPIAGALVLVCAGYFGWKRITAIMTVKKHEALYSQIQKVAELTVLKYNYSEIASTKKVRKNTNKSTYYSLVKFKACIRIGIPDVSKISLSFSEDGKRAGVVLPHTEVLENALLSQEVFDDNLATWQFFSERITTQEIFDTIEQIMTSTARENEKSLCRDADAQLVALVRAMLRTAGIGDENMEVSFESRIFGPVFEPDDADGNGDEAAL